MNLAQNMTYEAHVAMENKAHALPCIAAIQAEKMRKLKNYRKNLARKMRDDAMRSCGLVKVRGALGRTYWE